LIIAADALLSTKMIGRRHRCQVPDCQAAIGNVQ